MEPDRLDDLYGRCSGRYKTFSLVAGMLIFWEFIQVAWVVELGYGTPYLLDLGLTEQLTSLVWLAGPSMCGPCWKRYCQPTDIIHTTVSGLVAQPLIGAISDSSNSRYRRRYWIVMATAVLVLAGLGLGFTVPIARALATLFKGDTAEWDPRRQKLVCVRNMAKPGGKLTEFAS